MSTSMLSSPPVPPRPTDLIVGDRLHIGQLINPHYALASLLRHIVMLRRSVKWQFDRLTYLNNTSYPLRHATRRGTGPMPTVGVTMPSYNHEHYISEAMKSVLNQSVDDLSAYPVLLQSPPPYAFNGMGRSTGGSFSVLMESSEPGFRVLSCSAREP